MSSPREAFLCCPLPVQVRLSFSPVSSRRCSRQKWVAKEGSSKNAEKGASGATEKVSSRKTRGKPRRNSFQRIARKVGEARDKFREAADEANALKSSPEGFILGSDFSNLGISSMSLKQDLDVPPAPRYWGLEPEQVLEDVRNYLIREGYDERVCEEYIDDLRGVLSALRGWTLSISDQARSLLDLSDQEEDDNESKAATADAVDAIVTLLQLAGFALLPDMVEVLDPPSPDALPLGESIEGTLDPTLVQKSLAVRKHVEKAGVSIGSPSFYPYLFIATRGTALVRNSGLLFPQKLRAIERSYFNWIRAPFTLFVESFRVLGVSTWNIVLNLIRKQPNVSDEGGDETDQSAAGRHATELNMSTSGPLAERAHESRVRRVVPALKLEAGWNSVVRIFLPTFTQEPAHEFMFLMYREVDLDQESIRREARRKLLQQVKESVAEVINPIPRKRNDLGRPKFETGETAFDGFEKPIGSLKPVSVKLFRSVQWGTMKHFFPATFVLPATRDLLRIDALTFLGLISAIATYVRNAGTALVFPLLLGSLATYVVRVSFGWRSSLGKYRGQIARDRAKAMLSRQRSALDSLAVMAAEEQLPDVCSVWLSNVLNKSKEPHEIQSEIFGEVSLCTETVHSWRDWLKDMNTTGL